MPFPIQNPRLLLFSHYHHFPLPFPPPLSRQLSTAASSSSQTLPLDSPPQSSILSTRELLLSRQTTAVNLAGDLLSRLHRSEPILKSFIHVAEESQTLRSAEELDRRIEKGEEVGPLAGVLVGVKDNICTKDMASTGGSRILEGYRPGYDATVVRRLREKGAIVVGKTNLDEFGMGSTTEGSGFQVTANPWDVARVPGGSSGGSAAAVSARQCLVSLGSDTGGSVRQPASFCGVVGIKPTYGRVSRFGLMAYASSLDVIGCFGTSVIDTAILLSAISGHDRLDATSSKNVVPNYSDELASLNCMDSKPLKGLRVGMIRETLGEGVDSGVAYSIQAAALHLDQLGARVTEVSMPSFSLGLPAYYVLAASEASSNLSRYDGVRYGNQVVAAELNSLYGDSRSNGFGPEVKMRILMGTYALSSGYYDAYYKRAQQVRTLVWKSFKDALDDNDILISPAAPSAAYKIGEKTNDPLAMYAGDIMTVNVNLAGLPALVVPCGFVEGGSAGLPVGLQMIGSAFSELGHQKLLENPSVEIIMLGFESLDVSANTNNRICDVEMTYEAFVKFCEDNEKLLRVGHIFEQTLQNYRFVPPLLADN